MYNRTDIDNLAKETNYIRDNVEKIVRLSGILRQLNADSLFADNLALKGGTAINLVIAPLPRLSVDIDLDFTDNCVRMAMMRKRKEINERLDAYMNSEGYRRICIQFAIYFLVFSHIFFATYLLHGFRKH